MGERTNYDQMAVGESLEFGSYHVTREEIISFAEKWDPQPFHLCEDAAKKSVFGGLSACTAHIFAIQNILAHDHPKPLNVVAGLGMENFNLLLPVRPGDVLSYRATVLDKRVSSSKPDRGIIWLKSCLINQDGDSVIEQTAKIMVANPS